MPIQLQHDPSDRLIRTTATGVVTVSEFESHLAEVHRHGRHEVPELIDATAADISAFSQRDILSLADYARQMFQENQMARRALVGPTNVRVSSSSSSTVRVSPAMRQNSVASV